MGEGTSAEHVERLLPVLGEEDVVSLEPERLRERLPDVEIVLDDEDGAARARAAGAEGCDRQRLHWDQSHRNPRRSVNRHHATVPYRYG